MRSWDESRGNGYHHVEGVVLPVRLFIYYICTMYKYLRDKYSYAPKEEELLQQLTVAAVPSFCFFGCCFIATVASSAPFGSCRYVYVECDDVTFCMILLLCLMSFLGPLMVTEI